MRSFLPRRADLRKTVRLAIPVVTVQVGLMTMGMVDTIMAGHLSEDVLAGVGLGHLYTFAILIGGMGFLMALDPLISQAVGAGDRAAVALGMQRGFVFATLLTIPASLAMLPAGAVLTLTGQPAAVAEAADTYALVCIPGVLPMLVFVVFRQSLQALHRLRPIVLAVVLANGVNALLNWMLMYGNWGFPALGVEGAAWASTISRWFSMLTLAAFAWSEVGDSVWPPRPAARAIGPLLGVVRIGFPIAITHFFEFLSFAVIALLMGNLGTTELAAHQVAVTAASLTFMVPLGISAAGAVLVGNAIGRADPDGARRSAGAALVCGAGFMACSATAFLVAPGLIAGAITDVPIVLELAAVLIPIAGIFQVVDGIQVVCQAILRGAADTRVPLFLVLGGFWCVGFTTSLYLGFATELGARGLWLGLVAGLTTIAILLLHRVYRIIGGDIRRVVIDAAAPAAG